MKKSERDLILAFIQKRISEETLRQALRHSKA